MKTPYRAKSEDWRREPELQIIRDTREQHGFDFRSFAGVEVKDGTLISGDYSVKGLEHMVAVERKSLPDLVSCLGAERERFQRELLRAASMPCFCVVVEGAWSDLAEGRYRSKLTPASAVASVWAFSSRLKIPFFFCGTRGLAEQTTEGILRQWVRGECHKLKAVKAALKAV